MRLGQLARTVNVPSSEIVSFLASREILIKDHPNVKVDDFESMVMAHFGIEPIHEPVPAPEIHAITETPSDLTDTTVNSAPTIVPEPEMAIADEQPASEVIVNEAEEEVTEVAQAEETQSEEPAEASSEESYAVIQALQGAEVIKAPKVALTGLKVVGKIELPEPKPKAPKEPGENMRGNKRKAPLTPEERERQRQAKKLAAEKQQALREQRAKEKEARKIKEKKRKHYESKVVKPTATPKPAEVRQKTPKSAPKKQVPRTWLGKFWLWLNT